MLENEKKMGKIRKNILHFMQICWKMEKKGKNWEKLENLLGFLRVKVGSGSVNLLRIRIRILEVKKNTDPDPKHCSEQGVVKKIATSFKHPLLPIP